MAILPLVLLDALIKGILVLGIAAALVRLLRNHSAATRHAVWTTALLAQLALPALAIALPAWSLPILPPGMYEPRTLAGVKPATTADHHASPGSALSPAQAKPAAATGAESPAASTPLIVWIASAALGLWLAGVVLVLARLGFGTVLVARLARHARPVRDGAWPALARQAAGALGIRRPITLLQGNRLEVPVTWGTVHPIVLLPGDADEWTAERRTLVLMHELAHIKRYDALTQLAGQLALALFWMNPLVWLTVRRMAIERERACDDYVLRGGTTASTYAQELLEMVHTIKSGASPAFAALALARHSDFETRVLAILNPNVPRRAIPRSGAAAMAVGAVLVVTPLAALRPVAREAAAEQGTMVASRSTDRASAAARALTASAPRADAPDAPAPAVSRSRRPADRPPARTATTAATPAAPAPIPAFAGIRILQRFANRPVGTERTRLSSTCGSSVTIEVVSKDASRIMITDGRGGVGRATCQIIVHTNPVQLADSSENRELHDQVALLRKYSGAADSTAPGGDRITWRPQAGLHGVPVQVTQELAAIERLLQTQGGATLLVTADSISDTTLAQLWRVLKAYDTLQSTPPAGNRARTSAS